MQLRKLKADNIFDGEKFVYGKILIIDNSGRIVDIADDDQRDDIEVYKGILIPGFINCHCHLELSHLKNQIKEQTGLIDFVTQVMRLRQFEKDEIISAIDSADNEMYNNGIAAVGDICNTTDTLEIKKSTKIFYRNFVETMGFLPDAAETRFNASLKNVYEPLAMNNPLTSIVPHAPYSVSENLFALINQHSTGKIITIHNQESAEENKLFETGDSRFRDFFKLINTNIDFFKPSGKSSLQTYLPGLNRPSRILLVHNTQTSEEDILFAEDQAQKNNQQIFWVLCPNANLYIENKLPQINLLRKYNCKIALGTDSLASNHWLSIAEEIITLRKNYPEIPKEELFQWATLNGAYALGFDNLYGSFKKGKSPGVILLNDDLTEIQRLA